MDILIGVSLLPLLIFANFIIINLCKTFPKHILSISGVMIALDAIVTLCYTLTIKLFTTNEKLFLLGIGLAIFTQLVHKVYIMLTTFKKMFQHEIGN
tara:strand:+ start:1120 stop:1410 length:291 start_codon:yes stop_codon:yes gene_type:complete